jgi:hypothetical protein
MMFKFQAKFFYCLFILILKQVHGSEAKYTFNKFNLGEKTNMETILRNYAKSLTDTKLLKISNYNERSLFSKEEDILAGSVMISLDGNLSFSNEFLDLNDMDKLNNRKLLARAKYTKSLDKIGWSRLYVETFDFASAEIQSWAAGYLEGKLCAGQILDFYKNLVGIHNKESSYLEDVFKFYKKIEESIRSKTSKSQLAHLSSGLDLEYWISVAMVQAQSDGLLAGYNTIMKDQQFTLPQIYFINADGEVPELLSVFKYKYNSQKSESYSFKESKFLKKRKFNENFHQTEKFSKNYLKLYFGTEDPDMVWNKLMSKSHCSALIKLIPDEYNSEIKDVLIGHTTWDSYSEMHRIFKMYKFSFTMYDGVKKDSTISFSSYPGTLTSTDDFYLLNKKIVVLETTLEMLDLSLYGRKIPEANDYVPNYIRILVSNRLSNSGKEWTENFQKNNGGTYNSQWMIIDFSKFNVNLGNLQNGPKSNQSLFSKFEGENLQTDNNFKNLKNSKTDLFFNMNNLSSFMKSFSFKQKDRINEGFFYVLEQIPGNIEVQDMTQNLLETGYWASYNRPYFEKIFKEAGYYDMMRHYGKTYSYYDNPRSELFKSKINSIKHLDDFKALMQLNLNLHKNDHINTISPRYDIASNHELRKPAGGIDTKIVNSDMVYNQTVYAKSGPSTTGGTPPFKWSDWPGQPHYGLPDIWNFPWVEFNKKFIKN